MTATKAIVLKFGSSILADSRSMPNAVHEVARYVGQGYKVIAVVSAIAGETDRLFQTLVALNPDADHHHVADFVSTGERQSVLLLTVALEHAGIAANAVEPKDISLTANGPVLDSDPNEVDCGAIRSWLGRADALVVPGYVARDELGRTVLLGRGGSDDTALFLADHLSAECRLIKDVNGIYEWDPAKSGPKPRRYLQIHWEEALEVADVLVQDKAIRYAQNRSMSFEVAALGANKGSTIGPGPTVFDDNCIADTSSENMLAATGTS